MKKIAVAVFLITAFVSFASGQSKKAAQIEQEVLKVNREYGEAIVRGDVAAYNRIVADDFIHTGSNGGVVGKAQQIAEMKSDGIEIEFGRSDDERVRIYGNTAVVTGRWTMKGKYKNEEFTETERYTAVFVKRQGRWQLVAEQTTEIKQ